MELVQASAGKPVTLQVYDALTDAFRETVLVPAAAPDGSGAGCAGVVVRHARFDAAPRLVWHIGDVKPGSPAQHAGLAPDTDYIVGSPQVVLARDGDLFQYVAENVGVPLTLFVWSTVACAVRVVCITPTLWDGPGLFVPLHPSCVPSFTHAHAHSLGCDIMCGALHRIPRPAVLPAFTLAPPTQPFTSSAPAEPAGESAVEPAPAPVPAAAVPIAAIPVPVPVSPIAITRSFVPAPTPAAAAPAPEPTADGSTADTAAQTSALLEASDD